MARPLRNQRACFEEYLLLGFLAEAPAELAEKVRADARRMKKSAAWVFLRDLKRMRQTEILAFVQARAELMVKQLHRDAAAGRGLAG